MESSSSSYVYLQCVKQKSKLRLQAVATFAMRTVCFHGIWGSITPWAITMISSRGKYYYSITPRMIEVLEEAVDTSNIHIYEDEGTVECAICLIEPKSTVINPCGHYYMCGTCATSVHTCPICRGPIASLISKSEMD